MLNAEGIGRTFGDSRQGEVHALKGVSFTLKPGETVGLLGMNGAGKSTLLRILASTLQFSFGDLKLNDIDYATSRSAIKNHIGFLSGSTDLSKRLTGRETLQFFGRLCGMTDEAIQKSTESFIDLLEMDDFIDRYTEKYSTGQKQKVNICRAVIHEPELLILDEATTGLDPVARVHVVEFIKKMHHEKRMIIYSTHYFDEVEVLCDKVLILHKGDLLFAGTPEEVLEKAGKASLAEVFSEIAQGEKG